MALLVLGLLISLAACSGKTDPVATYHQQVVGVLQPQTPSTKEGQYPGLLPSLQQPLQVMACLEHDSCYVPTEFQELITVTDEAKYEVADYRGKICEEKISPPSSLKSSHQTLCQQLDDLRRDLDQTEVISRQMLAAIASAGSAGSSDMAKAASQRILSLRAEILSILERLKGTSWMTAVFANGAHFVPDLYQTPSGKTP